MGPKTAFRRGSASLRCFDAHTVYVGGLASNTHVWTVDVCGPRQEVKSEGDSGSWLPSFHLRFRRGELGKHEKALLSLEQHCSFAVCLFSAST